MSTESQIIKPKRGRPKRNPDASEVRQKLLRAGLIYLTEKGYSSVGVDDILKSAGVPKGGFYHYFQNKADYGAHLIDHYNCYFLNKLDRAFSNDALTPIEQLKAFTEDALQGMARYDFRRGCLVGNLGQEMGALPEEFRAQLINVLHDWQERTAKCLKRAQAAGQISSTKDPDKLAECFWIGWEGAVLRAKLERRAEPLTAFSHHFFAYLTS